MARIKTKIEIFLRSLTITTTWKSTILRTILILKIAAIIVTSILIMANKEPGT